MTDIKIKYLGGMVGSALGDAIGELAFQYRNKGDLCIQLDRLKKLRYTDDTAMAIGLAESIIKKGCLDQQDLGETFRYNYEREPWRGYASGPPTIFSMVEQLSITYAEAARSLFGSAGSLGNGAAMRIVPVGLFFTTPLISMKRHTCLPLLPMHILWVKTVQQSRHGLFLLQ